MRFFVLILFSVNAWASEDSKPSYVMCRNQKTVRTMRIVLGEDPVCQVIYSKDGRDKVVGSGRYLQSCQVVMGNIERNLTGAGWKCRDISKSAAVVEEH